MGLRGVKVFGFLAVITSTVVGAESSPHDHGMHHSGASPAVEHASESLPQEGGQSTFAAIIEMVALLESDPNTDWSMVDIDALRLHLRDMNRVMLDSEVEKTRIDSQTIRFDIRGGNEAVMSIQRMVAAHARYVKQSRGWDYNLKHSSTGTILTLSSNAEGVIDRLFALGFYGFMSLDSHHQQHHYMMAKGGRH